MSDRPAPGDGWRDVAVGTAAGVAALGLVLLGALWYFSDSQAAKRAHDDAKELWESKEPTSYSFDYLSCSGMCAPCTFRVTVRNGEVIEVEVVEGECPFDPDGPPTVEALFAFAEAERSAPETASFRIEYDPIWGFPEYFNATCAGNTPDCGTGLNVSNFEVEP